jgi:glyoxylase-like metal-dependent hydrolase (beta-lactamase superfamily II)
MSVECSLEEITGRTVIGRTVINGERDSNAGAVALDTFIVAVDPSSTADSAPIFRRGIEGHFKLPTKYLHVTHYHGDHTKGVGAFRDTVVVGARQLHSQMMRDGRPHPPELMFTDKLIIDDGGHRVELHYAGGHTVCSSIAYFPEEKVIFLGDLLFADEFPWAGDPSCDPDQWIAFFEETLRLDFDHVVPGHGPLCGEEEVRRQLRFLKELRVNTLEAIDMDAGAAAIKMPTIYEEVPESRDARTARHFYEFYSKKKG